VNGSNGSGSNANGSSRSGSDANGSGFGENGLGSSGENGFDLSGNNSILGDNALLTPNSADVMYSYIQGEQKRIIPFDSSEIPLGFIQVKKFDPATGQEFYELEPDLNPMGAAGVGSLTDSGNMNVSWSGVSLPKTGPVRLNHGIGLILSCGFCFVVYLIRRRLLI
jgi:hypothetical protein